MKSLENMSVDELLKEITNAFKKAPPKKIETTADGKIILDPNNKNDREWFENDEDYKF